MVEVQARVPFVVFEDGLMLDHYRGCQSGPGPSR